MELTVTHVRFAKYIEIEKLKVRIKEDGNKNVELSFKKEKTQITGFFEDIEHEDSHLINDLD